MVSRLGGVSVACSRPWGWIGCAFERPILRTPTVPTDPQHGKPPHTSAHPSRAPPSPAAPSTMGGAGGGAGEMRVEVEVKVEMEMEVEVEVEVEVDSRCGPAVSRGFWRTSWRTPYLSSTGRKGGQGPGHRVDSTSD